MVSDDKTAKLSAAKEDNVEAIRAVIRFGDPGIIHFSVIIKQSSIEIVVDGHKIFSMEHPVEATEFSLGRENFPKAHLVVSSAISRKHCSFLFTGGKWKIRDSSRNGTFIGGERVPKESYVDLV